MIRFSWAIIGSCDFHLTSDFMRASLFITCYNDTLYPETGRAVVKLLERLGVELDFHPRQTCCGQMHANTGFRREAYSQAKRFVRLYQDAETVVIPSS